LVVFTRPSGKRASQRQYRQRQPHLSHPDLMAQGAAMISRKLPILFSGIFQSSTSIDFPPSTALSDGALVWIWYAAPNADSMRLWP
jgi:hypothetical protein